MDNERTQAVNTVEHLGWLAMTSWDVHISWDDVHMKYILRMNRRAKSKRFMADTLDEVIGLAVLWVKGSVQWV